MRRTLCLVVVLAGCTKKTDAPPAPAAGSGSAAAVTVTRDASTDDAPAADAPPPDAEDDAGVPDTPCTTAAIKAARKEADALVKAGKPNEALVLLDDGSCFLDEEEQGADLQAQIAWRISDRAFAFYKAKLYENCYATAASQLLPYTGNIASVFDETTAVMKALAHNAEICHDAVEKQRGEFESGEACSFDENARAIPASVIGAGPETCIHVADGQKDADEMFTCGEVTLLRATSGGKPKKTKLVVEDGSLADGGVCCNVLDRSLFQKHGTTWRVLFGSEGRNCDGGTASMEAEDVYELTGSKLVLVHHLGAVHH